MSTPLLSDFPDLGHEQLLEYLNDVSNPIQLLSLPPVLTFIVIFTTILLASQIIHIVSNMWFGPASTVDCQVYINDFTVFKEFRPEWLCSTEDWTKRQLEIFKLNPEAVAFSNKMVKLAGISSDPDSLQHIPPGPLQDELDLSMASARYEAEIVMFSCVERLLSRNNLKPSDIDILIVNCSLFNPTPSLCAMIINKFKMREDIITYNLSGMGCSASPLAVQLAEHNLRLHPKAHPVALVVSTEILTQHIYRGNVQEFIMSNALFRMNGSALILSRDANAYNERPAPKWRLDHLTRLHLGSTDEAYHAIHLQDDEANLLGVKLSKELVPQATRGIKMALASLAPRILPLLEIIRYVLQLGLYKVFGNSFASRVKTRFRPQKTPEQIEEEKKMEKSGGVAMNTYNAKKLEEQEATPVYVTKCVEPIPNFKTAVNYFLIHAGGKGVVNAVGNSLQLEDIDKQHSLNVLHKFGNTSSTSVWYVLDDVEQKRDVKNGQTALALCLGSGIKVQTMYLTAVNRRK